MKTPKNHRKPWDSEAKKELIKLASGNTPTGLIAYKMGRSEASINAAASKFKVSLNPINKSPYNKRPKMN